MSCAWHRKIAMRALGSSMRCCLWKVGIDNALADQLAVAYLPLAPLVVGKMAGPKALCWGRAKFLLCSLTNGLAFVQMQHGWELYRTASHAHDLSESFWIKQILTSSVESL